MERNTTRVTPYSDAGLIARCKDPTQADFPILAAYWNSRTITGGNLVCPISGMTIDFADNFVSDAENSFYLDNPDPHQDGNLTGNIFNPDSKNFALICCGSYKAEAGAGGGLLVDMGNTAASGPAIRIRSISAGTRLLAIYNAANVTTASAGWSFTNVNSTTSCAIGIINVAATTSEYHIADINGQYETSAQTSTGGSLAGWNTAFANAFQVHGWSTNTSRYSAWYILSFASSLPSTAFMKSAALWMGARADGALYPGFMGRSFE